MNQGTSGGQIRRRHHGNLRGAVRNTVWRDGDYSWDVYPPGYPAGSTYGPQVELTAPGGRYIETTRRTDAGLFCAPGSYWFVDPANHNFGFSGTSAATAAASGTAALATSAVRDGYLTGEDARILLGRTITDFGQTGRDDVYGLGKINADLAVQQVTGANAVFHGGVVGGTVVETTSGFTRTFGDWPGITHGRYPAIRNRVRVTVNLGAFLGTPMAWLRQAASYGADQGPVDEFIYYSPAAAGNNNPDINPWDPKTWLVSVNGTQAVFETCVYDLRNVLGGGHYKWWPCSPQQVVFNWSAAGPVLVGVNGEGGAAASLRMVPNPTSEHVSLSGALLAGNHSLVTVHDLNGRLIATLRDGATSPSSDRLTWDLRDQHGRRVPTGLYFVRVRGPNTATCEKILVIH